MAPRRPTAKQASHAKAGRHKKRANPAPPSTRQLLLDAEAAMTEADIDTALKLAGRALETLDGDSPPTTSNFQTVSTESATYTLNPTSSNPYTGAAHTLMGNLLLEYTGEPDIARPFFTAAVEADPQAKLPADQGGGADKFLYLAQLSDAGGRDSVVWFERGAAALRWQIGVLDDARERAEMRRKRNGDAGNIEGVGETAAARAEIGELRHKLAEVLCAVAEVYMTDLSFEADAEIRCEALVTEAVTLVDEEETMTTADEDEASEYTAAAATVWQTLASVRVSQNRSEEAKTALGRSMEAWDGLPPEDPRVPAYAVRVSLVRLLLTAGMIEKAAEVAARLRDEDDTAVEVWYLGGYALFLLGEALKETGELERWKGYWVRARRWLRGCVKIYDNAEYEDDRLRDHVTELLKSVIEGVGEAEGSDDDDWEDDDEWEGFDDEDGEGDEAMES